MSDYTVGRIVLNKIDIENGQVTFEYEWRRHEVNIKEIRIKTVGINLVADFLSECRKNDFRFNYTLEDFKNYRIPFFKLDERLGYFLNRD